MAQFWEVGCVPRHNFSGRTPPPPPPGIGSLLILLIRNQKFPYMAILDISIVSGH